MGSLFTVGHSVHTIDYFANQLLLKNNVNYILDVRSVPYSRHASQFDREYFKSKIQEFNINYFFMGNLLGARINKKELFSGDGYLDFEKVRKSSDFVKGINNIMKGLKENNNIALMCMEKDPIDCHRAIMIARAFELKGVDINHILADGSLQNQKVLNERLLDMYFPNRNQLEIETYKIQQDYISQAYRMRNKEIGYRINHFS